MQKSKPLLTVGATSKLSQVIYYTQGNYNTGSKKTIEMYLMNRALFCKGIRTSALLVMIPSSTARASMMYTSSPPYMDFSIGPLKVKDHHRSLIPSIW